MFSGEHSTAEYDDIKLSNIDTGEEKSYDPIVLQHGSELVLDNIQWQNYLLSLGTKKIDGVRGFKLFFRQGDNKNGLLWEIGGWQNQDAIVGSIVNGRNSCLTQSLFAVETKENICFN